MIDRRWARINLPRETWRFGGAAPPDFRVLLSRPSRVAVTSVSDVCVWLHGCVYEPDPVAFGVPDHWQSPAEFEDRRRGDCEDHALHAWMIYRDSHGAIMLLMLS